MYMNRYLFKKYYVYKFKYMLAYKCLYLYLYIYAFILIKNQQLLNTKTKRKNYKQNEQ